MPIALRADFNAGLVKAAAKRSKDGPQARRLLTLAAIYDGATRTEAAKIGGVTLQIIRDWVMRFNALGPDGLIDRKPPGQANATVALLATGEGCDDCVRLPSDPDRCSGRFRGTRCQVLPQQLPGHGAPGSTAGLFMPFSAYSMILLTLMISFSHGILPVSYPHLARINSRHQLSSREVFPTLLHMRLSAFRIIVQPLNYLCYFTMMAFSSSATSSAICSLISESVPGKWRLQVRTTVPTPLR